MQRGSILCESPSCTCVFLRQGGMLWCSEGKIPFWFPPIIFSLTRWWNKTTKNTFWHNVANAVYSLKLFSTLFLTNSSSLLAYYGICNLCLTPYDYVFSSTPAECDINPMGSLIYQKLGIVCSKVESCEVPTNFSIWLFSHQEKWHLCELSGSFDPNLTCQTTLVLKPPF